MTKALSCFFKKRINYYCPLYASNLYYYNYTTSKGLRYIPVDLTFTYNIHYGKSLCL